MIAFRECGTDPSSSFLCLTIAWLVIGILSPKTRSEGRETDNEKGAHDGEVNKFVGKQAPS